jgi:hypothetical protein
VLGYVLGAGWLTGMACLFCVYRAAARRTKPPVSAYPFGPPPPDAAFGTAPVGQLGVHHPREIVRVERDYSGGEIVQFAPTYPLEFEGRVSLSSLSSARAPCRRAAMD